MVIKSSHWQLDCERAKAARNKRSFCNIDRLSKCPRVRRRSSTCFRWASLCRSRPPCRNCCVRLCKVKVTKASSEGKSIVAEGLHSDVSGKWVTDWQKRTRERNSASGFFGKLQLIFRHNPPNSNIWKVCKASSTASHRSKSNIVHLTSERIATDGKR